MASGPGGVSPRSSAWMIDGLPEFNPPGANNRSRSPRRPALISPRYSYEEPVHKPIQRPLSRNGEPSAEGSSPHDTPLAASLAVSTPVPVAGATATATARGVAV